MKKVLALVLAVLMLATVAFAADVINPGDDTATASGGSKVPGAKIKIGQKGIQDWIDSNPGIAGSIGTTGLAKSDVKAVNSTNYSVTALKYNEGKNLVESVKFDDSNDQLVIKLKQDYTQTTQKALDMTFTLKGKKVGKNPRFLDIPVALSYTVGYKLDTTSLELTGNDNVSYPAFADDTLYKVVQASTVTDAYGTLEFTSADTDTDVSVRIYKDDKYYLYSDVDADTDVLKKYADSDADITFLNFPGEPTFNATATVYFYKEEGTKIYKNVDGKLSACNAKWSEDDGAYILKTRTLGSYVFSDKALSVAAETPADTNPDTGANDVVGIATALAAVALVSAAAVSLKK